MPRRTEPDPIASAVGARIKALRKEKGLTAEKLAYQSDVGSKGFLSDIEAGLASPSLATLSRIANHLEVELIDLFTYPDTHPRHELVDKLRGASKADIKGLLKRLAETK